MDFAYSDSFFAQLPPALRDGDRLLAASRNQIWRVSDLDDEGEKHAALLSNAHPAQFAFQTAPCPPRLGQWYFVAVSSTMEAYALAWYICRHADDPHQHLFGLAPARELYEQIDAANLYQRPDLLVARSLVDAVCIPSQNLYNGPGMREAMTAVVDISHTRLSARSAHHDEKDVRAEQRASARDDVLDDAFASLSVGPRKGALEASAGLYASGSVASSRRFVNARRSLGYGLGSPI